MITMNGSGKASAKPTNGRQVALPRAGAIDAADPSGGPGGLHSLEQISTSLQVSRNSQIFGEGDVADFFYIVSEGAVRHCMTLSDGRRQIAGFALPGDCFGGANLDACSFAAEAVVDSTVIRCSWRRLRQLGESRPALRRQLLSLTMESLAATQLQLVRLGRMTVEERLSSFLLEMATRSGQRPLDGDHVDLPMGRTDIADHLGLTIETVSRTLSRFKKQRIIAIPDPGRIELRDVGALRRIAGGHRTPAPAERRAIGGGAKPQR